MVPFPQLERLLIDCDITVEAAPYLAAVGFRVTLANDCGLAGAKDPVVLKYAKRHRFILVCNDKHARQSTPQAWFTDLAKGGRVIEISGGHLADPFPVVGKLLIHRETWLAFFRVTHGAILLHDTGYTPKPPEKLLTYVNRHMPLNVRPEDVLKRATRTGTATRRKSKKIRTEQLNLPASTTD